MRLLLTLSLPVLLGACATAPGPRVSLEDLVADVSTYDVVFLGEEHDNDVGHLQQLLILKMLHSEHPALVLSMEMFERDVQETLDDYLAGTIDEEEFLADSRPWGNYRTHYRPLVEYAKKHGLRVIAANVPRSLAGKVSSEGVEAVVGDPHAARQTSAPKDEYWTAFQAAMEGHGGVDETTIYRYYQSQCLKDDTMAEAIVDVIQASDPPPFVVHVNGKFHSDARLGTAARVSWRMPSLRIAVVSMDTELNAFRTGEGAYLLRVPAQPEFEEVEVEGEADEGGGDEPAGGRPALGFMPGYDDAVLGVLVDALVEGGSAEKAGLESGDVIIRVGERYVESVSDYMTALADLTIGQTVKVTVIRGEEELVFDVKVGRRQQ